GFQGSALLIRQTGFHGGAPLCRRIHPALLPCGSVHGFVIEVALTLISPAPSLPGQGVGDP
ncbi:MAG TPA: hypothetical protein VEH75_00495, partial [Xanthobacteraceae bacterium]|nr:hypothetical protein [Xanthobacteraceae bacterium]